MALGAVAKLLLGGLGSGCNTSAMWHHPEVPPPLLKSERTFVPAAGRDLFLPLYDPLSMLLGASRLHAALLEQAGLRPGFRVLDVGCGTGTFAVTLKRQHPDVTAVAMDPDPKALARAKRKAQRAGVSIQFDLGFADALGYDAGTFDRVFSSMMFHHLPKSEREAALREIRRVLRPGGRLEFVDIASSAAHRPGLLARMIHPQPRMRENANARLFELMARAGFVDARSVGDRNTVLGPVAFCQASRPA